MIPAVCALLCCSGAANAVLPLYVFSAGLCSTYPTIRAWAVLLLYWAVPSAATTPPVWPATGGTTSTPAPTTATPVLLYRAV